MNESVALMAQCPRYKKCVAPVCPLDINQELRDYVKGEPKCTLGKARRMRIGADSELPLQGMTKREVSAKRTWDRKSESEKASILAKLDRF